MYCFLSVWRKRVPILPPLPSSACDVFTVFADACWAAGVRLQARSSGDAHCAAAMVPLLREVVQMN